MFNFILAVDVVVMKGRGVFRQSVLDLEGFCLIVCFVRVRGERAEILPGRTCCGTHRNGLRHSLSHHNGSLQIHDILLKSTIVLILYNSEEADMACP